MSCFAQYGRLPNRLRLTLAGNLRGATQRRRRDLSARPPRRLAEGVFIHHDMRLSPRPRSHACMTETRIPNARSSGGLLRSREPTATISVDWIHFSRLAFPSWLRPISASTPSVHMVDYAPSTPSITPTISSLGFHCRFQPDCLNGSFATMNILDRTDGFQPATWQLSLRPEGYIWFRQNHMIAFD